MEAVKEAVVTEAARGEVAMAAVEVADLLQQCALQQRLLAHRAVAARLPPRGRPLRDALAVEEVAARQHAADLPEGRGWEGAHHREQRREEGAHDPR